LITYNGTVLSEFHERDEHVNGRIVMAFYLEVEEETNQIE
jgi:hypothetical protein